MIATDVSQFPPAAMRELTRRVARGRKNRRRSFWRRAARKIHVARIGDETIESNLPLPPRAPSAPGGFPVKSAGWAPSNPPPLLVLALCAVVALGTSGCAIIAAVRESDAGARNFTKGTP